MGKEEKLVPCSYEPVVTKRLGRTAWVELYQDGWMTFYDRDPGPEGHTYTVSLSDEGVRALKNFFRRKAVQDVLSQSR
jgi:hypothetical protein